MVRYLTMTGKSRGYRSPRPFALRYRRANGTFYEVIKIPFLKAESSVPSPQVFLLSHQRHRLIKFPETPFLINT